MLLHQIFLPLCVSTSCICMWRLVTVTPVHRERKRSLIVLGSLKTTTIRGFPECLLAAVYKVEVVFTSDEHMATIFSIGI